jgi:transposase
MTTSKACKPYQAWLNTLKWEHTENTIVFDALVSRMREATDRVGNLDGALVKCVVDHPQMQLVTALQALRGIAFLSAVTIVAEVGDFDRFPNAPSFMSYVGVVPKEHSSGQHQHRGSITKTGDSLLRHVLVEAAHHARHQPARSELLKKRQMGLPQEILDLSWKAQNRLHEKYRHLSGRIGTQKALTAVAREEAGFIWAIAKATH